MSDYPILLLIVIPPANTQPTKLFVYEGEKVTTHTFRTDHLETLAHFVVNEVVPADRPITTLVDAPMGTSEHFISMIEGKVPNVYPVPTAAYARVIPQRYR